MLKSGCRPLCTECAAMAAKACRFESDLATSCDVTLHKGEPYEENRDDDDKEVEKFTIASMAPGAMQREGSWSDAKFGLEPEQYSMASRAPAALRAWKDADFGLTDTYAIASTAPGAMQRECSWSDAKFGLGPEQYSMASRAPAALRAWKDADFGLEDMHAGASTAPSMLPRPDESDTDWSDADFGLDAATERYSIATQAPMSLRKPSRAPGDMALDDDRCPSPAALSPLSPASLRSAEAVFEVLPAELQDPDSPILPQTLSDDEEPPPAVPMPTLATTASALPDLLIPPSSSHAAKVIPLPSDSKHRRRECGVCGVPDISDLCTEVVDDGPSEMVTNHDNNQIHLQETCAIPIITSEPRTTAPHHAATR